MSVVKFESAIVEILLTDVTAVPGHAVVIFVVGLIGAVLEFVDVVSLGTRAGKFKSYKSGL